MDSKLEELARRLNACRRRGNKLTLEWVLDSARILSEAKRIAGRRFGSWLRDQAHMTRDTARRHMRVAEFVQGSGLSISHFASLDLAKIYALSRLDFVIAKRYLMGQARLSAPLSDLSDVQFRRELAERFPVAKTHRSRIHVFREIQGAIGRLRKALYRGGRFIEKLTVRQRKGLQDGLRDLLRVATAIKIVA